MNKWLSSYSEDTYRVSLISMCRHLSARLRVVRYRERCWETFCLQCSPKTWDTQTSHFSVNHSSQFKLFPLLLSKMSSISLRWLQMANWGGMHRLAPSRIKKKSRSCTLPESLSLEPKLLIKFPPLYNEIKMDLEGGRVLWVVVRSKQALKDVKKIWKTYWTYLCTNRILR